jgi:hypothetical protein
VVPDDKRTLPAVVTEGELDQLVSSLVSRIREESKAWDLTSSWSGVLVALVGFAIFLGTCLSALAGDGPFTDVQFAAVTLASAILTVGGPIAGRFVGPNLPGESQVRHAIRGELTEGQKAWMLSKKSPEPTDRENM